MLTSGELLLRNAETPVTSGASERGPHTLDYD